MQSYTWMQNFEISSDDIEYLSNVLLEEETPLTSQQLALQLIEKRLHDQHQQLEEKYKDTLVYNPSHSYKKKQRIIFPALNYAIGTVTGSRPGQNAEYGEFNVIAVAIEGANGHKSREFASDLQVPHKLNEAERSDLTTVTNESAEDILSRYSATILPQLDQYLQEKTEFTRITGHWFPKELIPEVDMGSLHLADAVLDLAGGGPLPTIEILEQMGGLPGSTAALQEFALNYMLNEDDRFDEVGPQGEVLWYLNRLEPTEVRETPEVLQYKPVEYDPSLLDAEMLDLEREIADEYSDVRARSNLQEATIALIYPHRRAGTLPLNAATQQIFPKGRSPRIWVTLVDGQDGEEYTGWVVHSNRYIYGLDAFYQKHELPVGTFVNIRKGDAPDKVIVTFNAYRARTEWTRLLTPDGGKIAFENEKRAIGADYDDLMIIGVDDITAVDQLFKDTRQQKKTLSAILKMVIPPLGRLVPQGTVHAKTIYSAVNVVYRCPPGPIFATLHTNPDFEYLGGHYWKLAGD